MVSRTEGAAPRSGLRQSVAAGEEARLTPEGPTAAVVVSRGRLPLRARARIGSGPLARTHPGTAVGLGTRLFEVVGEDRSGGSFLYRLQPWPPDEAVRDRVSYGPAFVREAQAARRRAAAARATGPFLPVIEMLAALLPRPERQPLVDRLDLDVVRGAVTGALLSLVGGGVWLLFGFISVSRQRLDSVAGQLSGGARGPAAGDVLDSFQGAGPWVYFLRPLSLLLAYLAVTGFVRFLHSWSTREAMPDPLLALTLGAVRALRGQGGAALARARLGPERPDRVVEEGREIVVITAREKPDWTERATIQVGEVFYKLRGSEERADGRHTAIAYRLAPAEASAVIRTLVRYEPPVAAPLRPPRSVPALAPMPAADAGPEPTPEPRAEPEPEEPEPSPPQDGDSEGADEAEAAGPRSRAGTAPARRTRWSIEAGEQARLTPEGPAAAVIESLGALPLRARVEAGGVHHRPAFPGTCVVLDGRRYEVVAEEPRDLGMSYRLQPWRRENVLRDVVEYGPRLVRAAQRERERAEERARAARHATWLLPVLGLLPETEQRVRCDRLGLDPVMATLGGALLEVALAALGLSLVPGVGAVFLLVFLAAIPRAVGALALGEVAGGALSGLYSAFRGLSAASAERADPQVLPLTREAFWQRLEQPDRQRPQPDGSLLVEGVLPHLGWGAGVAGTPPAIRADGDYWRVFPLEPRVERGRLTHAWSLRPMDEGLQAGYAPRAPGPRHYQDEVLEGIEREWSDLFSVAPFLPGLLPRAAQERAYRRRGGPAGARRFSAATAVATAGLGVWFVTGAGAFNLASGLVLFLDAAQRLLRVAAGDYAPSLFGGLVSDYLRPEREAYQAHLAAERAALQRLRG